jgi:hypothetical protein
MISKTIDNQYYDLQAVRLDNGEIIHFSSIQEALDYLAEQEAK